jgi:NAD(P)-dependent dehydrogenase (short-subunit alcohol dehydrogenase family)
VSDSTTFKAAFDFSGKVALVTGGSRGLGAAMVRGFADHGADVVVTSRKLENCQSVARDVEALGRRALAVACHVGHWSEIEALIETAYAEFGRIDILVNNAGMAPTAPSSLATDEALIDRTFAVNFKGPFRLSAIVGTRMMRAGGGAIINISSTGAVRPEPAFAPYAAAKAALNVLTKAHALEFGPAVRVNAIMAGPFWTDISREWREEAERRSDSAVGRIGRAEEIVTTALYLASSASSYTTGTLVTVDGGLR